MKSEIRKKQTAGRAADKPPATVWRAVGFSLSNVAFLLLGMGLMALIASTTPVLRWWKSRSASVASAGSASGPWGELEYTGFTLREPPDYLPDSARHLETPPWFFENHTPASLRELFGELAVSANQKAQLLDTNRWQSYPHGVLVRPTRELVLGLGRDARQRLYSLLHASPLNPMHHDPFRFRVDGFDDWFAHSGLPDAKLALLRNLTFSNNGGAVCLADLGVLQEEMSPAEFRKLFEVLYSEPSFLMQLQVRPESDVDGLIRYWGRGGRERVITPLLKSLARSPQGGSIDVALLLPPFAQQRLNTFNGTNDAPDVHQDCFWTALNFFNEQPDPRMGDFSYALAKLNEDYTPTREARRYGDLLLLMEDSGKTVHACVFIADDVVFTKNGADYLQPWILMKIPDMLARYATDRSMQLITLRPKGSGSD
jgi:hypothetical protein